MFEKNVQSVIICRTYGFSVADVIKALNMLARHDENKRQMVELGIVPIYYGIVLGEEDKTTTTEREEALNGIWIVTFVEDGVKACHQIDGCIERRFLIVNLEF